MALRPVLGPLFNSTRPVPPPAPAPAPPRLDVSVSVTGTDDDAWTIGLAVPTYDLATHNQLAEVRVYLVEVGQPVPVDGPAYVASSLPFEVADLRASLGGINVTLPLPEVPPANYLGQVVLMMDDDVPAPPAPAPVPVPPPTSG